MLGGEAIRGIALAMVSVSFCALLVKRDYDLRHRDAGSALNGASVSDWRTLASDGTAIRRGDAAHTVVVFSDYQRPGCRRLEASFDSVLKTRPASFHEVLRHYPLRGHAQARAAAIAAICGSDAGEPLAIHQALFYTR